MAGGGCSLSQDKNGERTVGAFQQQSFGTKLHTNAASCQGDPLCSALSHHLHVRKAAEANTLGDTKETKLSGKQILG